MNWSTMEPQQFTPKPKQQQTAMPLSTPSGLAVTPKADPAGTLDMLALLEG